MSNINRVILSGHLTRDAVVKVFETGSVIEFAVASNSGPKDKEVTLFMDCQYWVTSSAVAEYLVKGKKVAVEGRLKQDSWEKDGVKHTKLIIKVDNLELS